MGTLPLSFEQESPPSMLFIKAKETMAPFPEIKSKHSLVAKHVTEEKWNKLNAIVSKTSGFTLAKAIACAVEFDNQHCGIYAGDEDSYIDFADVFDPLICEYHGLPAGFKHVSDMDVEKIKGNVADDVPVHSVRIRVGRSIQGFGLSPGITKQQRVDVEALMKNAFAKMEGDLAGSYYPLTGMDEKVHQQLVDDHFLFMSGDPNLKVAGMERDWPEGRVSSTTPTRPSWSGSTRRISSVLSPCKREGMSRESSSVSPEASRLSVTPLRLNLARTSCSPPSSVTFTLAPPTWALACVPPSTLTCPAGSRTALMA